MPAMPPANDLPILNHSFAQREPKMRAKIFKSMDFPFPLEQCNANAISFYADSKALWHQVPKGCNPYPSVHVADDILRAL